MLWASIAMRDLVPKRRSSAKTSEVMISSSGPAVDYKIAAWSMDKGSDYGRWKIYVFTVQPPQPATLHAFIVSSES